jgi:hypothetical protein
VNADLEILRKLQNLFQPLLSSFRQEALLLFKGQSKKSNAANTAHASESNQQIIGESLCNLFLLGECLLRLIILFNKKIQFDKPFSMLLAFFFSFFFFLRNYCIFID